MKKKVKLAVWRNVNNGKIAEYELSEMGAFPEAERHELLGTREIEVECEEEPSKPMSFWISEIKRQIPLKSEITCIDRGQVLLNGPDFLRSLVNNEDEDTVTETWWGDLCDGKIIQLSRYETSIFDTPLRITYKRSDLK